MKFFSKRTFKILSFLTMLVIVGAYVFFDYKLLPYWLLLVFHFVEEATEALEYLKKYLEKVIVKLEEKKRQRTGSVNL